MQFRIRTYFMTNTYNKNEQSLLSKIIDKERHHSGTYHTDATVIYYCFNFADKLVKKIEIVNNQNELIKKLYFQSPEFCFINKSIKNDILKKIFHKDTKTRSNKLMLYFEYLDLIAERNLKTYRKNPTYYLIASNLHYGSYFFFVVGLCKNLLVLLFMEVDYTTDKFFFKDKYYGAKI